MVHSVFCTPGALSAYRRSVIMPFMPEWVNQKFMGRPANIGEDRAISNIILREGHQVVFQKSALVYTEVPKDYAGLCRMFLRWSRSNVRENLEMFTFAFRRIDFADEDLLGMQINLVMQTLWTLTPMLFVGSTLYCLVVSPLANTIAAIPVTPGGAGVRETTLQSLLTVIDIPPEASASLGLLMFFGILLQVI